MLQAFTTLLFPQSCLLCGCRLGVSQAYTLCDDCWSRLEFISEPICKKCGAPKYHVESIFCKICHLDPTRKYYSKVVSVLLYNALSQRLIQRFKYRDDLALAKLFSKWLVMIGKEIINEADFLVPVPLHVKRLRQRHFNQSALLIKNLNAKTDKSYILDVLERRLHVKSQSAIGSRARKENVQGIFTFNKSHLRRLEGKRILLVDDVITTGSTVNECARVLIQDGRVSSVDVLTIARTIKYS